MTDNGATTMSGETPTTDNPKWFLITEPTQEQVTAAKTIGHKTYNRELGRWQWWLEYDTNVRSLGITSYAHTGDWSARGQNIKNLVPSVHERIDMRDAGREAISKFITSLTVEVATRVDILKHLAEIEAVVEHGDLRCALEIAKLSSMPFHQKAQLVKNLHLALIYFPDFADREEETLGTARQIIEHHQPKPASEVRGSVTEGA